MAVGIIAAIAGIAQVGMGVYQGYQGRKQAEAAKRPDYVIPQEAYESLSDAEIQAMEGLPADQKRVYIENIQRDTQRRVNQLQDRKAGIAGIGALGQVEADAYRQLLGMDATARQQNMAGLQAARNMMMDQKAAELGYDMALFKDQSMAAQAMKGAGMQNVMGGIYGAGQTYADYQKYQDLLNLYKTNDSTNQILNVTPQQQQNINQNLLQSSTPSQDTMIG